MPKPYEELYSIQIVFGVVYILLAAVIALTLFDVLSFPQSTINAILFALILMLLLKDGMPNLILGLRNYLRQKELLNMPEKE
jgi:hypothetical protein